MNDIWWTQIASARRFLEQITEEHTMTHLCGQRALVLNNGGQIRSTQGAGAVRGHTPKAGGKG